MTIYHLTAKTGSRQAGQSALAHFEYIARQGKYSKSSRDRLVFAQSGNMPDWAKTEPKQYWSAADQHERANGRLYKSVEFALPAELSQTENIKLARELAETIVSTSDGKLPYSLAIHEGKGHNPHCHLMVNERVIDGHDRSPEAWFRRAATGKKLAKNGGAKKTELLKPQEWLLSVREIWSELANRALAVCKSTSRIDHRSNKARGIQSSPSSHLGPRGFKKRRPVQTTETAHQKRDRQLEIIRINRELDELKSSAFNGSRQALQAKLNAQKSVAPARAAPVRSPKSQTPNF